MPSFYARETMNGIGNLVEQNADEFKQAAIENAQKIYNEGIPEDQKFGRLQSLISAINTIEQGYNGLRQQAAQQSGNGAQYMQPQYNQAVAASA